MFSVTGVNLASERELIIDYSEFCLKRYVPAELLENAHIQIDIISNKELPEEEQKEFKEAHAWMQDKGMIRGKRRFVIHICKSSINKNAKKLLTKYKTVLKNLGHELVHVKQYLNGEMYDFEDGTKTMFKGQAHALSKSKKIDWAYFEYPWELEAYGRMEGLYHMYDILYRKREKAKKNG